MSNLKACTQGDIGDTRLVRVDGIADLAAVTTARALVSRQEDVAALEAEVDDPEERTVSILLGGTDGWLATRPAVGSWKVQLELTFASGDVLTWPNNEPLFLPVQAEIQP